jgi:hypothetical protein
MYGISVFGSAPLLGIDRHPDMFLYSKILRLPDSTSFSSTGII